jgi:molecular chaperone GrpE
MSEINDIQDKNINADEESGQETNTQPVESPCNTSNARESKYAGVFGKRDRHNRYKEEIERLKMEKVEWQDKFLRLYSEFDNFKKRTQKERLEIIKNAAESLIISILPVIDDMERALKYSNGSDANMDTVREGELLIYQKLIALLKQRGLSVIQTQDCLFDTDFHEAISIVPAQNEKDKGRILEEIEKGYLLNEKVIRFAKVIIYQ